jgi:hypothetical protein
LEPSSHELLPTLSLKKQLRPSAGRVPVTVLAGL